MSLYLICFITLVDLYTRLYLNKQLKYIYFGPYFAKANASSDDENKS